jgi:N-acyl-D-aspartate/D-glutamate deacylase
LRLDLLLRDGTVADWTVEQDLPGRARRLAQKADGIAVTIVNGAVAIENGEARGDFAGQVLKDRRAV